MRTGLSGQLLGKRAKAGVGDLRRSVDSVTGSLLCLSILIGATFLVIFVIWWSGLGGLFGRGGLFRFGARFLGGCTRGALLLVASSTRGHIGVVCRMLLDVVRESSAHLSAVVGEEALSSLNGLDLFSK